jgi:hypothetical protein
MANGIERWEGRRYYVLKITVIYDLTPCRQTESWEFYEENCCLDLQVVT